MSKYLIDTNCFDSNCKVYLIVAASRLQSYHFGF